MTVKDVTAALRAHLLADADVAATVGTRIHPGVLPQGQRTASVVVNLISAVGDHHMTGPSGLGRPRLQLTAWAPTPDDADTLARQVKTSLDGFSGAVAYGSASPQASVTVQGVFFDSARDGYDDVARLFFVQQDFLIWFEES
jgi:hypothetical protein